MFEDEAAFCPSRLAVPENEPQLSTIFNRSNWSANGRPKTKWARGSSYGQYDDKGSGQVNTVKEIQMARNPGGLLGFEKSSSS
jgi:hypothetical protein